jgi:hypothetical protein
MQAVIHILQDGTDIVAKAPEPLQQISTRTSAEEYFSLSHASRVHRHYIATSLVEYIQKRHEPGSNHDATYSAQCYDALQQMYLYSFGTWEEDLDADFKSLPVPTFYFYVAGGAEVEAMP